MTPYEDIPETEAEMIAVDGAERPFPAGILAAAVRVPKPLATLMNAPEVNRPEPKLPAEIVEIVTNFHDDWDAGLHPRIEDFLEDAPSELREQLLPALLRTELIFQADSGEPLFLFRKQYLERFPKHKPVVDRLIAEVDGQEVAREVNVATVSLTETVKHVASRPEEVENDAFVSGSALRMGRFTLLEELGAGTGGCVYRAHDPKLSRDVAIKVPHPDRIRSAHDVERFLRAARAAAQLRHDNICPIYEVSDVPGQYFVVMALIKGKSLNQHLIELTRLPIRQALLITKLIATAMQDAHQRGIVHRDLKPENIQIDDERHIPVIMDFGVARFNQPDSPQLTLAGQLFGTPYYMSPEQALGDTDEVGPATDIYSLGVILYEMLCGVRPITGRTVGEVLANVHYQEPIHPSQHRSQIDANLADVCLKAIAKSSAERFSSMSEFAKALSVCLKRVPQ